MLSHVQRHTQPGPIVIASSPHGDTFGYAMPPPGLLRLGAWLARDGWSVALDDLAHRLARGDLPAGDGLVDAAAERLLAGAVPWVLGLSVMGATLPAALGILERVRALAPSVVTLLGGPGTTGIDGALLERFPFLDGVVRGEGEETTSELLALLARGKSPAGLPGLTWRDGAHVARGADRAPLADLGALPPPAWHLLPPLSDYKRITGEEEGLVPIDSGRGCVYDCSFCTIGRFWGRRSRPLPAAKLVDEMDDALALPGAKRAYLCHDLFGADRKHAMAFAALRRERGPAPFEIRARIDHLDPELAAALGAAGCYRVLLGIESADGELRNRHGKHMGVELDVFARLRALSAAGITPILSLILGLPGEGKRELRSTLDLALRASLSGGVHLSFHLVNPQPGCGLGESHGAASRPVADLPPDMALGAGTTAPELARIAAHPDLFSTFAVLTGEPGGVDHLRRLARIALELPRRLERTPRTFAALAALEGLDTLDLFDRIAASGATFETRVRARRHPALDALLAWELGLLRTAARGGPGSRGLGRSPKDAGGGSIPAQPGPRRSAEVLHLSVDAPALADALTRWQPGEPLPEVAPKDVWLALHNGPRGVRTLAVNAAVAALLARADGAAKALEGDDSAALRAAYLRLRDAGLVVWDEDPADQPARSSR
ncbi:MAG: radical SAM protein [Planctomycetaceae bacterium]|nr:radical SAM protein [Planctomycetaceae bacterium]